MLDSLIPDDYKNSYSSHSLPVSFLKNKSKKKLEKTSGKDFSNIVQGKGEGLFESDINQFLEQLESLEQELVDKPNSDTVFKYKKGISDFLTRLTKNYKHFEFYNRKKYRCKIWTVVDKQLEDLFNGVVSTQLKGIMLLDKLQEIKGLIIDLKVGNK